MANRIFATTIVVLWLGSMIWLFVERIMPSFFSGQPPIAEAYRTGEVVAWSVQWGGKPVGYAASVRVDGIEGTSELHNHIALEDAPLAELAPTWMRHILGEIGNMTFNVLTRIEFDTLDNFTAFESRIAMNKVPSVLLITGKVKDSNLELEIRSNGITYPTSIYLPHTKSLNEALFPDAKLPRLVVGRRWRKEVYSPFHAPNDPIEIVQAEVVSEDSIEHQGKRRQVLCVEYHGMVGSGVPKNARLHAVSWVGSDGTVLRHDAYLGGTKMRFERLTKTEAAKIGVDLFERLLRQGGKFNLPEESPDKGNGQKQKNEGLALAI